MELTILKKIFIQKYRNIIFNFNITDGEKNLISKYVKPLKRDIWRPMEEPTSCGQAEDGDKCL